MIDCKIGIIAFPKNYSKIHFLNIGEIYDKKIKNNINTLYNLHSELKYLCCFRTCNIEGKIIPDNLEEIIIYQTKYKLTRKIFENVCINEEIVEYNEPELYDLSCMVPLFENKVPRYDYNIKNNEYVRVFILLPEIDPIKRGEIINNCLNCSENREIYFYLLGDRYGSNLEKTINLTRRYLLSCNVPEKYINRLDFSEFPDCIMETITIIESIFETCEIYIAVSKENIRDNLEYIRLVRKLGICERKINFICD